MQIVQSPLLSCYNVDVIVLSTKKINKYSKINKYLEKRAYFFKIWNLNIWTEIRIE